MPKNSAQALSIARLLEAERDSHERYVDLCIVLRVRGSGETLIRVGGRWDKREKRYVGPARRGKVVWVHKGQLPAARWFCEWLRRYVSGDWEGFRRVWSALFVGGRRGGKSHLGVVCLALFALTVPRSNVWAVSPAQEETDELEQALLKLLPRRWFRYRGSPKYEFRLANGARIFLRSGAKPSTLKRGRCDFCLYNEGQNMTEKGFLQIRGGTSDSGSLTIVAANPPDTPGGLWVQDFYEGALAGKRKAEVFQFDPQLNPFITLQSLLDIADETDEKTYRREVLGEFVPIGDTVLYAWSDAYSIADVPEHFEDITREFTKRHLGRAFDHVIGADFQKSPHMAAAVFKVFVDPTDPKRTPLLWLIDEVIVEEADEDDLIDAIEERGYNPRTTGVIGDASGEWQDAERTRGRGSFDWFRKRGWRFIYPPDPKMQKNPDIVERCKVGNSLLRSHSGNRRLFSCKRNARMNRSLKHWEMKNGAPHRRSEFAHACDAVTYVCWRFFPRRRATGKAGYRSVKKLGRRKSMRAY